jgi:hypothetical protein
VDGGSLFTSWGFSIVHSRISTVGQAERERWMKGKIHQILMASVGWKSRDGDIVPGIAVKVRKERKVWERSSSEKREEAARDRGGQLQPLLQI